ncbi:hypothetical protein IV87_GL000756 [Pediococcus ethanolidurans]|uniref:Uncharacterized protein n=1 Tax=Pediococcus ethanolidurans TaxID=319653 RepID=A0A0R2JX51_9LACO|nr:hypothetical protein IV87_GL000756 [Pediococcus ethanolidurans]
MTPEKCANISVINENVSVTIGSEVGLRTYVTPFQPICRNNPSWLDTKMNKNKVNAYKPKSGASPFVTEPRTILFVKSINHSKTFCFPVGFNFKFLENKNTTTSTIIAASNPEIILVVLKVSPKNWKVETESPLTEDHLFS